MKKIYIIIFAITIIPNLLFSKENSKNSLKISYYSNVYNWSTKEFIYTENHTEFYKNEEHLYSIIEYKYPDRKTFARKKIEFGKKRTQPDFLMEDFRYGYRDKSVLVNQSSQEFSIEHQRSKDEKVQTKLVQVPGTVVVDGGFDYFIRDDFDAISKGEVIKGNFLLVNRLDYFQCRVVKTANVKYRDRDAIVFLLRPENLVLRAIADKIQVTYDLKTKRLLEYIGVSNLMDNEGKDFPKVKIVFQYPKGFLD
jgi:hypothetical protein